MVGDQINLKNRVSLLGLLCLMFRASCTPEVSSGVKGVKGVPAFGSTTLLYPRPNTDFRFLMFLCTLKITIHVILRRRTRYLKAACRMPYGAVITFLR